MTAMKKKIEDQAQIIKDQAQNIKGHTQTITDKSSDIERLEQKARDCETLRIF